MKLIVCCCCFTENSCILRCSASILGGLYELFSPDINHCGSPSLFWSLRIDFLCSLLLQICPLVANAVSDLNPQLKTLNGKIFSFCQIFGCFVDAEYMRDFLPYCSCSQSGPVCRDRIFPGVIAHYFKILYRLELEGKELHIVRLKLQK